MLLGWNGTAYPVKVHVYGAPGDLAADRLPLLASKRTAGINGMILKVLSNGGSYSDMMTVRANSSRILDAYDRLRREEIKVNYSGACENKLKLTTLSS